MFGREGTFERCVIRRRGWIRSKGVTKRNLLVPACAVGGHDVQVSRSVALVDFYEESSPWSSVQIRGDVMPIVLGEDRCHRV